MSLAQTHGPYQSPKLVKQHKNAYCLVLTHLSVTWFWWFLSKNNLSKNQKLVLWQITPCISLHQA